MKNKTKPKSLRENLIRILKTLNITGYVLPVIIFCVILILYVWCVFSNIEINDNESVRVISFNMTQIQLIVNLFLIPLSLCVLIKVLRGKNPFNIYLLCIYLTIAIIIGITLFKNEWKWTSFLNWEYILLLVLFALLTVYESYKIKLAFTYFKGSKNDEDSQDDERKNLGFCVRTKDNYIDVGWGNYTKVLKSRISHTQLNKGESFAIGITGQWGSGKTTFLEALENELGNDFIVIKFMPWYSSSPKTLIKDFFDCVSSELGSMHIDIDFSKYIELLQEIDSTGILKIINKFIPYNDNNSIENVKKDIEERLSLIEKKVVIIIDDTDRLRSDELMEMLKIIRLTANFNNVVFVVSYDKDYILEKINEAGIDNNSEYLKKIFPLEIILPLIERYEMINMFLQEMENAIHDDSFVKDVEKQLHYTLSEFLFQKYIKNFRDVKNFTNTMIISHDLLEQSNIKDEISFRDFFWIEVIRTYFPKLYDILSYNRNIILDIGDRNISGGGAYLYMGLPRLEESKDSAQQKKRDLVKQLIEQYGDEVENVLQILFGQSNDNSKSIKRYNNYYKYFTYRLPHNIISNQDFFSFLMSDKDEASEIENYKNENKMSSLYFHLTHLKLDEWKSNMNTKNLYMAIFEICCYFNTQYVAPLFKNNLKSDYSKFVDSSFVYNLLLQRLQDKNCNYTKWNQLLALIYPRIVRYQGTETFVYKSILNDKEIEELACINCTNYLRTFSPNISEITKNDSDMNKFVKIACVAYYNDKDNGDGCKKCLVYDSLLAHYSRSRNSEQNNKTEFMVPLGINDDDDIDPDYLESLDAKKEALFGSLKKFDEFVKECFVSRFK